MQFSVRTAILLHKYSSIVNRQYDVGERLEHRSTPHDALRHTSICASAFFMHVNCLSIRPHERAFTFGYCHLLQQQQLVHILNMCCVCVCLCAPKSLWEQYTSLILRLQTHIQMDHTICLCTSVCMIARSVTNAQRNCSSKPINKPIERSVARF